MEFFKGREGKLWLLEMTAMHCTTFVPPTSFDRYYSCNSDFDESESFKPGTISRDDVLLIARELGPSWKTVGRVLNVPDSVIDVIEADELEIFDKCYSKCNCVVFRVIIG